MFWEAEGLSVNVLGGGRGFGECTGRLIEGLL